jgi:putative DNA primase/helicase
MEENYDDVMHQLREIGCEMRGRDGGLKVGRGRVTCGKGGKFWYHLHTFSPHGSSRSFIVGSFGRYGKGSFKVEWDRKGLSDEQREQFQREQAQAREREQAKRAEDSRVAALGAGELWRMASRDGQSPYLVRKQVEPEACRFLRDGSVLIPLLRYDMPREQALRAVQRIYPGPRVDTRTNEELPQKTFTKGFSKNGCCLRLGEIDEWTELLLACEGYATGLSIRMGTARQVPVFVTLDAYNLGMVVPLLRQLYPNTFILVCADDDWKTKDHLGPNPGRNYARRVAKATERCEIVWPVFDAATREDKDTDYNDLHVRQGLGAVEQQLGAVIKAIKEGIGRGR